MYSGTITIHCESSEVIWIEISDSFSLSRNTPYYSDVTGPDMGLILVVNSSKEDYFYNIFNTIGFNVSYSRINCRSNRFIIFRFRFMDRMNFPIQQVEVRLNVSLGLVRKSLSELMLTAFDQNVTLWDTKQINGNVCSMMKTRSTIRSTHEVNAF